MLKLTDDQQEVASSDFFRCTTRCTNKAENTHETTENGAAEPNGRGGANEGTAEHDGAGDTLTMLAAALVNLSAADRAKLANMLLAGNNGPAERVYYSSADSETGWSNAT